MLKEIINNSMFKFGLVFIAYVMGTVILIGCTDVAKSNEWKDKSQKPEHVSKNQFAKLESEFDARLGVYAIDTHSNKTVSYQSNERFAYTSTFKALAAAIVLQRNSREELDKIITYTGNDLVTYSPITEKHVDSGMSLKDLCEAAIRYSDNTAGNLLLKELGGPEGFQEAMRESGDNVIHSNRIEPDLNEATPGDIRDTSTAKALARSLQTFAIDGDILTSDKQKMLTDWLKGNTTGDKLIRAGVPNGWEVGDKSGAGGFGTRNDIAIVWPPDRKPIVIAILSSRDEKEANYDDDLIKKAAEVTINTLEKHM